LRELTAMPSFARPIRTARPQRGAAALIVTMLLFFAMVLAAVFVNRNLVFEQRSAANQYRSTLALEAAEAGLEWALAQLNNPQRIGADCLPSGDPAATSFRARYLAIADTTAVFAPVTWNQAGAPTPLQVSCVRGGSGWSCSCPTQSLPVLTAPAGPAPAAAFLVQFMAVAKPGLVRIAATGCTSLAGVCVPGGAANAADASAKTAVAAGLFAGLRTPPAAAATTRSGFDAGTAAIGVHNPDPATGVAIDAGGPIVATQARLTAPAGATQSDSAIGNDAALVGLTAEQFFATYFGVDKTRWKSQPAVTRVSCAADCGPAVTEAIAAAADQALIWIDGDLTLSGPLTLGSAQHPAVIVAGGSVRIDGAVAIHGVLYGNGVRWDNTSGGAYLRGALLSEAGYQGSGAPELYYDRAVLALLNTRSGSFARVSGSWHDF
jgi:Tfp pilus assembly protein PilX